MKHQTKEELEAVVERELGAEIFGLGAMRRAIAALRELARMDGRMIRTFRAGEGRFA